MVLPDGANESIQYCMVDREKLSKDDWVNEGLKVLQSEGSQGLKADRIARRLKVSRGSFYWHFENIEAYELAVLSGWEDAAVDGPYRSALAHGAENSAASLPILLRSALSAPLSGERAVLAWAGANDRANSAVDRVSNRRRTLLAELFELAGLPGENARARADAVYALYLGRLHLPGGTINSDTIDEILMMFLSDISPEMAQMLEKQ